MFMLKKWFENNAFEIRVKNAESLSDFYSENDLKWPKVAKISILGRPNFELQDRRDF